MASLVKLRLSMIGSVALVIGITTLILSAILSLFSYGVDAVTILTFSLIFVIGVHVLQWLISPWIIEALYRVKPVSKTEDSWIAEIVERVARASGLKKTPKAMISYVTVPNAFAYGNFLSGYKVAITQGLIGSLPREEIEAVVAHEVGHIKHRDVEVMMVISILPALIYWLGRILVYSGFFSSGRSRESKSVPVLAFLVGIVLIIVSFLSNLIVLYISRLREYYADSNSVLTLPEGGRNLQRALARILVASGSISRPRSRDLSSATKLKALLISDPELGIGTVRTYDIDEVVEWIKSQKRITPLEIFSTHPDPAKRLRFIDKLEQETTKTKYTLLRV
ncbi:MAG: zinc metalloprotease HtpX, partial [Thermoprotei archaeon]